MELLKIAKPAMAPHGLETHARRHMPGDTVRVEAMRQIPKEAAALTATPIC
jgi:hypothetical protein